MAQQQQEQKSTQPKSNSLSFRISDLEAQDAHEFFDGGDWHLDNTLSFTNKLKTSAGAAKIVVKSKPSNTGDGLVYKCVYETQVDTKVNGRSAQFKLKPSKVTAHFDLGFRQLGSEWLNPYVVVNTPTTFTNLNAQSKTTLGGVFHLNLVQDVPMTVNANLNIGQKNERYTFDYVENFFASWRNFSLSNVAKIGLSGPVPKKSMETSLQYSHGAVSGYLAMVNGSSWFSPQGVTEVSAGVTHNVTDSLEVAAEVIRTLGENPQDDYNVGASFTHCPGFDWTVITKNFATLGFLMGVTSKDKKFSASACYEKSLTDMDDFNWGLKLTYKQ